MTIVPCRGPCDLSSAEQIAARQQGLTELPVVADHSAGSGPADTLELVTEAAGRDVSGGCATIIVFAAMCGCAPSTDVI